MALLGTWCQTRLAPRFLALAVLLASLLLLSSGALAQSWTHPELVDYDQASEEYSPFWEQALAADEEGYLALVQHARTLWDAGGKEQRTLALAELRTAVSSKSHKPQALFWLGEFLYADRQWQACGDVLSQLYAMEPGFRPKQEASQTSLDFNLASCLLYSGKFEGAIEHFKRIMTLDYASDRVELRLGEAYMALGRLDEAIEFLTLSALPSGRIEAQFALAVALDRAERITESHNVLAAALRRDADLSVLRSSEKTYAPAEDEHYYLGLAHSSSGTGTRAFKARALYYFRRYLEGAASSPWRKRAEQHRDALGKPEIAEDLVVAGSARWDAQALRAAIAKQEAPLRACVAGQPLLLLQVDLSFIVGQDEAQAQVRATKLMEAEIDKQRLRRLLECVETATRNVRIPKPSGERGRHASAQFSLLGDS